MEGRLDTVDHMPVPVPEGGAEVSDEPIDDMANQLAEAKKKIERMQPMLLKAASFIDGWNAYYKIYSSEQYVLYYHDILKFTDQLKQEAKS
jgi:hypothetical protein